MSKTADAANTLERVEHGHSRYMLPVILLAIFVVPISISGTAVALHPISLDLGSSPSQLQWVVNGFSAAFALATLAWGALSGRVGYRRTFVLGLLIVLVGSLASAASNSLIVLDLARALSGVGAAAIAAGGSAILSNAYTGAQRQRVFGVFGSVLGLGLALGPTIAGSLVDAVGWRGVFLAFTIVMLLVLPGARSLPAVRADLGSASDQTTNTWLRDRQFLALLLVPVAGAIGYVTVLSYLPVALSAVHGISAGATGVFMIAMTAPVLIGPVLATQLVQRIHRVTPMTVIYASLVCLLLGDLGLLTLSPARSISYLLAPMVFAGFGFGLAIGLVDGEALARVPQRSSGTAAGLINFVRLGSEAIALGVYAVALTRGITERVGDHRIADLTASGQPGHAAAYADAFHLVVIGMTIGLGIVTVAIVALGSRKSPAGVTHRAESHPPCLMNVDPCATS